MQRRLARISHQIPTATAYKPMSTVLRSKNVLNVLSSTPVRISPRAPCIHGLLHRLATVPGKKCGLLLGVVLFWLAMPVLAEEVSAVLDWVRRVELSTPVSGLIREVMVEPGDRVAEGTVLLSLDARSLRAQVEEAQAEVARERENREEAQRQLERTEELYERTLIADHELQVARIDMVASDARYHRAEANLTRARLNLEYSQVRAPFDGMVVQRNAEVGQTIVTRLQSTALVVLAEAGRMLARATVPIERIRQLANGQSVMVRVEDESYQGHIRHIGLEAVEGSAGSPRYDLEIEFELPADQILRTGQPATLTLP